MATARNSRARALAVDVKPVAPKRGPVIAPEMIKLAQETMIANAAKNKATRDEKKSKEALHKKMIQTDTKQFSFTVEIEGAFQSCEAVIAAGTKEYIDVEKLRKLVDEPTFMKIISATKGATVEFAGENIAIKATSTADTPEALSVSKIKE